MGEGAGAVREVGGKKQERQLRLLVVVNGHLLLLALHFMACACQLLSVVAIFAVALATTPLSRCPWELPLV